MEPQEGFPPIQSYLQPSTQSHLPQSFAPGTGPLPTMSSDALAHSLNRGVPAHNHGIPIEPRAMSPEMRAYRACLHCRGRKTRCDLTPNNGQVPCKRCMRENRECVLGESHRGGRRERKKKTRNDASESTTESRPPTQDGQSNRPATLPAYTHLHQPPQNLAHHQYPNLPQLPSFLSDSQLSSPKDPRSQWQGSSPADYSSPSSRSRGTNLPSPASSGLFQPSFPVQGQSQAVEPILRYGEPVRESIVSADLQHPSDALKILDRVDRDPSDDDDAVGKPTRSNSPHGVNLFTPWNSQSPASGSDEIKYKPLLDGLITRDAMYSLISVYEKHYHPYFPIVPKETFEHRQLPRLSRTEPHLISAILTVASKEDELVHRTCYDHMQKLVYNILAGSEAGIEAVTALLILSQWVSSQPKDGIEVGRGEEDRISWMYIGTAVRLGYFLGIDKTAFKGEESQNNASYRRKKLVWTACYLCDRLVSVRLGKGFWARGPGPLSGLRSKDFPDLQPVNVGEDNFGDIFEANLELTQIFSNVHDVLYSTKDHGWKQMLEGRYAKHLDDFRNTIRIWQETWNGLQCSLYLKQSLNLSYQYCRLYVNAFAYQATMSRKLRASKESGGRPMPQIDSSTSDARFIFEAIDAAKDLISSFNEHVSPDILRYMPSQYYLYIIYSVVFLYKARSTTTMSGEERVEIQSLVNTTIDRLEKTSSGAINMGSRYSRLLKLLWRRGDMKDQQALRNRQSPHSIDSIIESPTPQDQNHKSAQPYDPPPFESLTTAYSVDNGAYGNSFSWLDLPGAWTYANQNNNGGGSAAEMSDMLGDDNMASYDMNTGMPNMDYLF